MVDILAIGSHPDDIEFGVGGILAKATAQGQSVVMVDLTMGELASHGTVQERRAESMAAAEIIGAERHFLEFRDCQIVDTPEHRLELVRVIRHHQPRLVLAPMWKGERNHPDHLATGAMARHACRLSRFKNVLSDQPIHRVEGILHYPARGSGDVDLLVDISEHLQMWKKMISCHKSQMKTCPYLDWCLRDAAWAGSMIGVDYAQRLVAGNPVVVDDILSVARGTLEL